MTPTLLAVVGDTGVTNMSTAAPDEPALVQRITTLLNGQPPTPECDVRLVVTREERPRADHAIGGAALCLGFPRVAPVLLAVYCVLELGASVAGLCFEVALPVYNAYWLTGVYLRMPSYAKFVYTYFACRSLFVLLFLLPNLGRVADVGFVTAVFYAGMNFAYAASLYYMSAFSGGFLWSGPVLVYTAPLVTLAVVSFTLPGLLGLITAYTPGHAVNQHLVVQTVPDSTTVFVVGDVNAQYPKTTSYTA